MSEKAKRARRWFYERSYSYETHDASGNLLPGAPSKEEWLKAVHALYSDIAAYEGVNNIWAVHSGDVVWAVHSGDVVWAVHSGDAVISEKPDPDHIEEKELHIHGCCVFKEAVSESTARRRLHVTSDREKACTAVKKRSAAYSYLLHRRDKAVDAMKTAYGMDALHYAGIVERDGHKVGPVDYLKWCSSKREKAEEADDMASVLNDCLGKVLAGFMTVKQVQEIYQNDIPGCGLDLSMYYSILPKVEKAYQDWLKSISEWYLLHGRCLTTIYMEGRGGSGKTRLARAFCNRHADVHGTHFPAPPGKSTTVDFADGYEAQACSFYDEVPARSFGLEQFLSAFDPINVGRINSRHKDKTWFADYAVLASSVPLEGFIRDLWYESALELPVVKDWIGRHGYGKSFPELLNGIVQYTSGNSGWADKIRQIRRRIPIKVCIPDKPGMDMHIYILDLKDNKPYVVGCQNFADAYHCVVVTKFDPSDSGIEKMVDCIDNAIKMYYEVNKAYMPNGEMITPWSVEKPPCRQPVSADQEVCQATSEAVRR